MAPWKRRHSRGSCSRLLAVFRGVLAMAQGLPVWQIWARYSPSLHQSRPCPLHRDSSHVGDSRSEPRGLGQGGNVRKGRVGRWLERKMLELSHLPLALSVTLEILSSPLQEHPCRPHARSAGRGVATLELRWSVRPWFSRTQGLSRHWPGPCRVNTKQLRGYSISSQLKSCDG